MAEGSSRNEVRVLLEREASQLCGSGAPSFIEASLPSAATVPASRFGSSPEGSSPGFWDSPSTWVVLLEWHPMSVGHRGPSALGGSLMKRSDPRAAG